MGLCKCPKKKVTNLFCFEHTVNVCEHCLVANHSRCVVQSYLQWLQDSDYDPLCRLCGKNLSDESCGPCVRLLCYDLFHWSCLDTYARSMPSNTAPAGYSCPVCKTALFPGANVVSPVVDTLKDLLSTVNWARAGLGLPMIKEPEHEASASLGKCSITSNGFAPQSSGSGGVGAAGKTHNSGASGGAQLYYTPGGIPYIPGGGAATQSIITMQDESSAYSRGDKSELFGDSTSSNEMLLNMSHDHDKDKYKRRPAFQWFSRWYRSHVQPSGIRQRVDPNASIKRFFIILLFAIIGLITLIIVFSRLGRSMTDNDPLLDPIGNPNIRVGSE